MSWDRESERKAGKSMAIGGSVFGIVFILIWCITAASMGAGIMLIFGLPMLGFMIFRLKVLLQKSRAEEKPAEPWEQSADRKPPQPQTSGQGFCPYCGSKMETEFVFCPQCGRRR